MCCVISLPPLPQARSLTFDERYCKSEGERLWRAMRVEAATADDFAHLLTSRARLTQAGGCPSCENLSDIFVDVCVVIYGLLSVCHVVIRSTLSFRT